MALKQVTVCLVAFVAATVSGLNYNPSEFKPERSFCPPILPDPNLNEKWLRTIDYWYLPKGSQRDFFLAMKQSTSPNEFNTLSLQTVQNTCFMMSGLKEEGSSVQLYGLERKMIGWTISFRPMRKGVVDFFLNGDYSFTTYIVLTDNKSYRLQIDEHKDGTRDFRIAATSDVIPAGEYDKIYRKLESLGFKRNDVFSVKGACSSDSYMRQIMGGAPAPAPVAAVNSYARGVVIDTPAPAPTAGAAASSYGRGK